MRLELRLDTNLQPSVIPCHSNKIVDSTLLQEYITEVAICSKCKNSKCMLELWQDESKRSGLDECLFTKCT